MGSAVDQVNEEWVLLDCRNTGQFSKVDQQEERGLGPFRMLYQNPERVGY